MQSGEEFRNDLSLVYWQISPKDASPDTSFLPGLKTVNINTALGVTLAVDTSLSVGKAKNQWFLHRSFHTTGFPRSLYLSTILSPAFTCSRLMS